MFKFESEVKSNPVNVGDIKVGESFTFSNKKNHYICTAVHPLAISYFRIPDGTEYTCIKGRLIYKTDIIIKEIIIRGEENGLQ